MVRCPPHPYGQHLVLWSILDCARCVYPASAAEGEVRGRFLVWMEIGQAHLAWAEGSLAKARRLSEKKKIHGIQGKSCQN